MDLSISEHSIKQFRLQAKNPNHLKLSDSEIKKLILSWWEFGTSQKTSQYNFSHKFSKYGLEDSEHRKAAGWILSRVDSTIVTVHLKTLQEKRRDKRKRLKYNQQHKKKGQQVPPPQNNNYSATTSLTSSICARKRLDNDKNKKSSIIISAMFLDNAGNIKTVSIGKYPQNDEIDDLFLLKKQKKFIDFIQKKIYERKNIDFQWITILGRLKKNDNPVSILENISNQIFFSDNIHTQSKASP